MSIRAAVVLALGILLGSDRADANPLAFDRWVAQLRADAIKSGISTGVFDATFAGVRPIPRVLELDSAQPEQKLSFEDYVARVVPQSRIEQGRKQLRENLALLKPIAAQYGVPAPMVVALWGVESNYGQRLGDFSVIAALATLAYDGRRSGFFRSELLAALRVLNEGHIQPSEMIGSWAGAMGQCQFMPSSFLRLAVDQDGDGRRDIWRSRADVFGSIANYMRKSGWRSGELWGREVRLPAGGGTLVGSTRSVAQWHKLGLRRTDGGPLPNAELAGQLIEGGNSGRYFLVYRNFRSILAWNRSNYFALAVGLLADALDD